MATEWRQRPIENWPGKLTRNRKRSNFRTGWSSVQDLLNRELRALNARGTIMLVALDAKDFRIDGQPRANARAQHPGVILSFESKHGPLRYACDTFDDFADNIYAIALGLEALRKVERYGIANDGQQYRGYSALGAGTVMGAPMDREEAARVLTDLAGPDWWDDGDPHAFNNTVRMMSENAPGMTDDAYCWAVKLHHPDHGGDADLFRRATEARDVLSAA